MLFSIHKKEQKIVKSQRNHFTYFVLHNVYNKIHNMY